MDEGRVGEEVRMAECGVPEGFEFLENTAGTMSGAKVTSVYLKEGMLVVLGVPDEEYTVHNCDEMGCGQEHVLLIIREIVDG